MGGESKQTQTISSTTQPWAEAQPMLKGLLGKLDPLVQNSGLSPTATGALDQLSANAANGNPFSGAITDYTTKMLGGGGATGQNANLQAGLDAFRNQTNPLASNTDYNPYNTPGFADALKVAMGDITNSVNGQFAAAGRDFSGSNQQALARGLSQGAASTIANQYNQNVANQQNAARGLLDAQNGISSSISGNVNQGNVNAGTGVTATKDALAAQNYTPTQQLQIEQLRQQIPAQNLGLLANIGIPIAGLGSSTNGTSTTTNQMSGLQQAAGWAQIGQSLFGGGGSGGGGSAQGFAKLLFG